MVEFFVALVVLLAIVAAMSVGVIMGRKPIAGSCGGVGAALGEVDYTCEICGGDPAKCEENTDPEVSGAGKNLGYDASSGKGQ
ncbi:MAG: hypothetical protein CMK32_00425 [Porticoccaceae bacterium]|nr:hypothetical protein [Porticoccaceae bacterium]